MADGAQHAAGGGHCLAAPPPNFRGQVLQKIVMKLTEVYRCQLDPSNLYNFAVRFEESVFRQSNSKEDYLTRLGRKMIELEQKRQPVVQQAQMGGNSSVAAMPRGPSAMSDPGRPASQLQNMHIKKVTQEQPVTLAPMAPVVQLQPCHQMVQTQSRPQFPLRQLQPTNFARYAPASVSRPQGQPVGRPNAQPNHLLGQNAGGIGTRQPQRQLMRINQQDLRVNQQHTRYQTHGTQQANVAVMQIGHHGGQNNQQNAPLKACEQVAAITVSQQSSLPRTSATMGLAVEVDWREKMFQKINSLKDAYLELVEFDRSFVVQSKTKEEFESLPKEQADQYIAVQKLKKTTRVVLNFLQLQKNNMPNDVEDQFGKCKNAICYLLSSYRKSKYRLAERNAGRQSQDCGEPPRITNLTGDTAQSTGTQQKQHEQPTCESISTQLVQHIEATTPPPLEQNHLAGQAEDNQEHGGAEALAAINLTGDTAPLNGGTSSQQKQQEQPADERTPQFTVQDVPAATSPSQQQTHSNHSVGQAADDEVHGGAEDLVAQNIERLLRAARSFSPAVLHSLANDMGVNLKRAYRETSWDSSCVSFERDAGEFESSGESSYKKRKTNNGTLLDEIRSSYSMLADTTVVITGDKGADGTEIEFRYSGMSLAPDLKLAINASEVSTKLLVPADYPRSSPVLIDNSDDNDGDGQRKKKKLSGIPGAVNVAFRCALRKHPEPRSIEEMAMAWESCTQRVVVDFAQRHGGGTFSSRYGRWESYVGA